MVHEDWKLVSIVSLLERMDAGTWGEEPSVSQEATAVIRSTNYTKDLKLNLEKIAYRKLTEKHKSEKMLKIGDLLLEKSGGGPAQPVGRVVLFKEEGAFSFANFLQRLTPDSSQVIPEFLYYVMAHGYLNGKTLVHQKQTTGIRNLDYKEYLNTTLFLPPLKEQQKIAEILSSVDEAIEKTEAIIKQTETVKKGLMQQLLTKGIGHTEFKQTEIGEVPVTWEVLNFKEACDIVNGQVDPTIEPYRSMPNIGSANIAKFTGQLLEYQTASTDKVTSGKYLFGSEHVLFSKIRPELAKVTYPGFEGLCSADIYPVKAKNDRLLPEFIKYILLDQRFYKYSVSVSGRTGMPKVNRRELDNYKVLCPSLEEQKKIVSCISAIESKETIERKKLINMLDLKKSLMQTLLTGKTRVNVDQPEVLI